MHVYTHAPIFLFFICFNFLVSWFLFYSMFPSVFEMVLYLIELHVTYYMHGPMLQICDMSLLCMYVIHVQHMHTTINTHTFIETQKKSYNNKINKPYEKFSFHILEHRTSIEFYFPFFGYCSLRIMMMMMTMCVFIWMNVLLLMQTQTLNIKHIFHLLFMTSI